MELFEPMQEIQTEARKEFKARLKVAIALTLQLQEKLLQWGERMKEASRNS